MGATMEQQRAAIRALARHFATALDPNAVETCLSIGGKPIAIDVVAVEPSIVARMDRVAPRLRFDKVVLRLVAQLQTALANALLAGTTAIVTLTAPIRLPGKTATALVQVVRGCLAHAGRPAQHDACLNGNQVRIRLVDSGERQVGKLIALVHNPDSDPDLLPDLVQCWLQQIDEAVESQRAPEAAERWLAINIEGSPSQLSTYRQVHAQLDVAGIFTRALMVFPGDRVESLDEPA